MQLLQIFSTEKHKHIRHSQTGTGTESETSALISITDAIGLNQKWSGMLHHSENQDLFSSYLLRNNIAN